MCLCKCNNKNKMERGPNPYALQENVMMYLYAFRIIFLHYGFICTYCIYFWLVSYVEQWRLSAHYYQLLWCIQVLIRFSCCHWFFFVFRPFVQFLPGLMWRVLRNFLLRTSNMLPYEFRHSGSERTVWSAVHYFSTIYCSVTRTSFQDHVQNRRQTQSLI